MPSQDPYMLDLEEFNQTVMMCSTHKMQQEQHEKILEGIEDDKKQMINGTKAIFKNMYKDKPMQ
jgi:hypothetical protein